jgi:hypothetical protein
MLDELKSLVLTRLSIGEGHAECEGPPPRALCYFAVGTHTASAEASSTPATSVLIDTF